MKNRTHSLALILCLLSTCYVQRTLNAQHIVWEYEIPIEEGTYIGPNMIENEQVHINVNSFKADYVISLNLDGHLESLTFLNGCKDNSALLPFTNGTLLTSGLNCFQDGNYKNDSRVYSKQGELLMKGPAFGKGNYNFLKTESGYYFLKIPYRNKFDELTLGFIDWDFNIKESSIAARPMSIGNLGITGFGGPLSETRKGYIIAGFNYGKIISKNQQSFISGFVAGFDKENSKFKWQYPRLPDNYVLRRFRVFENIMGLLRVKDCPPHSIFETITETGLLFNTFEFKEEIPIDFIVLRDRIIALFKHHITVYTFQGKVIKDYKQYNIEKSVNQVGIEIINENNFIIFGYDMERQNAIIRRLSLEDKPVQIAVEEESFRTLQEVKIDEVDEDILSLSIFPNPASLYINFKINGAIEAESKFIVEILSTDGKPVFSQEFNESEIELPISNLASGQYFYRLFSLDQQSNKKIFSGKFIKVD